MVFGGLRPKTAVDPVPSSSSKLSSSSLSHAAAEPCFDLCLAGVRTLEPGFGGLRGPLFNLGVRPVFRLMAAGEKSSEWSCGAASSSGLERGESSKLSAPRFGVVVAAFAPYCFRPLARGVAWMRYVLSRTWWRTGLSFRNVDGFRCEGGGYAAGEGPAGVTVDGSSAGSLLGVVGGTSRDEAPPSP